MCVQLSSKNLWNRQTNNTGLSIIFFLLICIVINAEDLCSPDHFECLTFVPEDLCKGQSQDHNYYVVCRNLLAGIGGTKGLLHSPPHQLVNISLINYLQHNCVYREQISREQAINQLEKELQTYVKRNDGNT